MVGPSKPKDPTWYDFLPKSTRGMPGRVVDPSLVTLNEIIDIARAKNSENDVRASPNHKPRKQLDMMNVGRAFMKRIPTRDRMEAEVGDIRGGSGMTQIDFRQEPTKPAVSEEMPEEFKNRPKLKLLWELGTGKLDSKTAAFADRAMQDGKLRLSEDDMITLEAVMPLKSELSDLDYNKMSKIDPKKIDVSKLDPYLQDLMKKTIRRQQVSQVMDGLRTVSIGTFGIIGGGLGTVGGPGGTIAGGALGAMAGNSLVDTTQNLVEHVLDKVFPASDPEGFRKFSSGELAERALTEGAIDMVTGGLGQYAPFVARKLKQKMLGITAESMAAKQAGRSVGVDVLPIQVGRPLLSNATNVFARMPLIGVPIRKRLLEQTAQVKNFIDTLPGRISTKNFSDADVGVELDVAVQNVFEKKMQALSAKQLKIRQAADKLGAFIPTTEVSAVAQKWLDIYSKTHVNKASKHTIKKLEGIIELSNKGKISMAEWDDDMLAGIRGELEQLQGAEGTKAMKQILEAARVDLATSGTPGLRQLAMDKQWEAGFREYETGAAKKFMQLDRNRFKQGVIKLGMKNPDELVNMLIAGNSRQFATQVRGLVGNDVFKDLSARYLDNNMVKAIVPDRKSNIKVDFDTLARNLGLDNPKSTRFGVTQEMLRGTGVTVDQLNNFIRVGKIASRIDVPDASTFVARRVVLGGLTSIGLGAAGLFSGHLPETIVLAIMARHGAKVIANPENVKLATLALDANTDQAVRRTSVMRLLRLTAEDAYQHGAGVYEPGPGGELPR